jgi:hypothetical protein
MNKTKTTNSTQGVKFDDRTLSSRSLNLVRTEIANYLSVKKGAISNFTQNHSIVLKYAALLGVMCLVTNEAYAVDIVQLFETKIATPIHSLVKNNYGKGIAILAGSYMVTGGEGADLRMKAKIAGIGAFLGYALGELIF